jgi:hypothetical protein
MKYNSVKLQAFANKISDFIPAEEFDDVDVTTLKRPSIMESSFENIESEISKGKRAHKVVRHELRKIDILSQTAYPGYKPKCKESFKIYRKECNRLIYRTFDTQQRMNGFYLVISRLRGEYGVFDNIEDVSDLVIGQFRDELAKDIHDEDILSNLIKADIKETGSNADVKEALKTALAAYRGFLFGCIGKQTTGRRIQVVSNDTSFGKVNVKMNKTK